VVKITIYFENKELRTEKKYFDDAGIDLKAKEKITIQPGEIVAVPTGVTSVLDEGTYGQVVGRSSMNLKGIDCKIGTIDASYRGEIKVVLHNLNKEPVIIEKYDRIAQMIIKNCHLDYKEIIGVAPSDTERGSNGFGSTGR